MEQLGKIKELAMDSLPSKTIWKNSEAKLDPEKEIESYLAKQNPEYLLQLQSFDSKIGEAMGAETKLVICIPVAGHQEAHNIYHSLEGYARQRRNPKEFEVLLFVNSPEGVGGEKKDGIERTLAEIERAKKDFPELQLRVTQSFLPQNEVRIGNIRKMNTDLALLRQKNAKISRDLILVSNDVDNEGISENYVGAYIKYFEEHPEKEGAVGNLQYDPNAFIRFPVIHMWQELSTLLDQVGFQNSNITLLGNNSCMKSSIYAAIGGYPPGLKTGEQDWTGKTIRKLRKKSSTLGFVKDGPLVTSSRRAVISSMLGKEGEIEFGDQPTETQMRALDLESFPIFDYADKEELKKLRDELEKTINKLVDTYEAGEALGKNNPYYIENLRKVGFECGVNDNGLLYIGNMDRFIERQEQMQGMIKGGEKNMAKVMEASWGVGKTETASEEASTKATRTTSDNERDIVKLGKDNQAATSRRNFLLRTGAAIATIGVGATVLNKLSKRDSEPKRLIPEELGIKAPVPRVEKKSEEEKIKDEIEACKQIIQSEQYEKILGNPYLVSALYYSKECLKTMKLDKDGPSRMILAIYPMITRAFRDEYIRMLKGIIAKKTATESVNLNKQSLPVDSINVGGNLKDNHLDAIDLFVKEGSPIHAMSGGIVVLSENGWKRSDKLSTSSVRGGNTVIIFNPQTQSFYRYAHMKETQVRVGDVISNGQPIGVVGHTGMNASKAGHGQHLHFEINTYDATKGTMKAIDVFTLKKKLEAI